MSRTLFLDLLIVFALIQFILLVLSFILSFRKDNKMFSKVIYKISFAILIIIIFFTFIVLYKNSNKCSPGYCEKYRTDYVQLPK